MNEILKTRIAGIVQVELRKEFIRRRKINPNYSLRAYANFLDIDQSLLSKVMNGRRSLSDSLIEKLQAKLHIRNIIDSQTFITDDRQTTSAKPLRNTELSNYISLLEDEVSLLENWIHFAILELLKTKDFNPDSKWIALRFGVHKKEVEDALARLARCGFIKVNTDYSIKLLKPNITWIESLASTEARREMQRQLLRKSLEALDEISFRDREHTSLTVAISRERLPDFKKRLNEVCLELDTYLQPLPNQEKGDEVYQITLSLFPLTKLKNK
jgi:uncharacterized protein (TIGR02147 family)